MAPAPERFVTRLLNAELKLGAGDFGGAAQDLRQMAGEIEAYVAECCPTTDSLQWFSFPTFFERLAYRRVEDDPRELRDVGEPYDRVYADLGLALANMGDLAGARAALSQAVRWNPMECAWRLDLAEVCLAMGDEREWLALSFSVFERASHREHLVRAYANFARHFAQGHEHALEAACLACAARLGTDDAEVASLAADAAGTPADPSTLSDEDITRILGEAGIPEGANAEIAICLIMCAADARALGDERAAGSLVVRARDLVGEEACRMLAELVADADAEVTARELAKGEPPVPSDEPMDELDG